MIFHENLLYSLEKRILLIQYLFYSLEKVKTLEKRILVANVIGINIT